MFLVVLGLAAPAVGADSSAGSGGSAVALRIPADAVAPRLAAARPPVAVMGPPPEPRVAGSPPPAADSSEDELGGAALARIPLEWRSRLQGWTIEFHPPRGSLRGLTRPGERRIDVYVDTDDVFELAGVVAHELGHAFDLVVNDSGARRRWKAARGIGATVPWWPTPGRADFATGSGDFAECFATWQLGTTSRSAHGRCSASDLQLLEELIG